MPQQRSQFSLMQLAMTVILAGLIFGAFRSAAPAGGGGGSEVSLFLCTVGIAVWFIAWGLLRAMRTAPVCTECARRFLPPEGRRATGPFICPRCRQRHLSPAQAGKEKAKGTRSLLWITLIMTIAFGVLLQQPVAGWFPDPGLFWIALPIVAIGATLGFFGAIVLLVVLRNWVKTLLARSEGYAFSKARKAAGREGDVTRDGPLTYWCSGPDDPVPLLREQLEIARGRFATIFGDKEASPPPVRVICFGTRAGFETYHGPALNLSGVDGLYASVTGTVTFCNAEVPYRLFSPDRTARILFGFVLRERYRGSTASPWLQQGVSGSVASGGEDGALARLNRRMLAALARGTAMTADELFASSGHQLLRLVTGGPDHPRFVKLTQFNGQCWSVVEYLAGKSATGDVRQHFRAFAKDRRSRRGGEAVFEGHFGFGYQRLFEGWRDWVLSRGVGTHEPPPSPIHDALVGRIIPMVVDHDARIMDRIEGIRSMGGGGYVLGADALIDLLDDPGEIPREEIVWALESISGQALGEDVERWSSWWASLPISLREAQEAPSTS